MRPRSGATTGLALALGALACAGVARAHESRPLYVEIAERGPELVELRWRVPLSVPAFNLPELALAAPCAPFGPALPIQDPGAHAGRQLHRCAGGPSGADLVLRYPVLNPSLSALVRFVRASGEVHTALLGPEETTWRLPERETRSRVARQYAALGMEHILGGYDHLLFLVCLLLIARTWRRVLITITGFTLAHSVTLALAALGVVRVPVAPVEAAIALSIVCVATEIARPARDTLTWRNPIAVSASFGLLHGFGFAAVLHEIGLPQTEIPAALLFFNLGVEIGQILFVSGVIALFLVSRRAAGRFFEPESLRPPGPALERAAAYAVGSAATLWLLIRVGSFGS